MDIGAMRIRILFQKQTAGIDEYRNHINTWEDYFECWATASYSSGDEVNEAGQTVTQESMDFTCRYCSELAAVTTTGFRVAFGGKIYNILAINPNAYKKNSLRFHCERNER